MLIGVEEDALALHLSPDHYYMCHQSLFAPPLPLIPVQGCMLMQGAAKVLCPQHLFADCCYLHQQLFTLLLPFFILVDTGKFRASAMFILNPIRERKLCEMLESPAWSTSRIA